MQLLRHHTEELPAHIFGKVHAAQLNAVLGAELGGEVAARPLFVQPHQHDVVTHALRVQCQHGLGDARRSVAGVLLPVLPLGHGREYALR
jgi:hypothetical protein